MTDAFSIVEPGDVPAEPFPESGIDHRKLTAALGATRLRVNTVRLSPGEATAAHAHERQEEVYVAVTGGSVEVGDVRLDVPAGTVVRIGPEPARRVRNDTDDETHVWIMLGAPPVGSVADFGEYVMPDERDDR